MTRKPDTTQAKRSRDLRERRKAQLDTYEQTLLNIRDDRAKIRTLDDAITAAAMALAPPRSKETK